MLAFLPNSALSMLDHHIYGVSRFYNSDERRFKNEIGRGMGTALYRWKGIHPNESDKYLLQGSLLCVDLLEMANEGNNNLF
jgi:hypothetical protein